MILILNFSYSFRWLKCFAETYTISYKMVIWIHFTWQTISSLFTFRSTFLIRYVVININKIRCRADSFSGHQKKLWARRITSRIKSWSRSKKKKAGQKLTILSQFWLKKSWTCAVSGKKSHARHKTCITIHDPIIKLLEISHDPVYIQPNPISRLLFRHSLIPI